MTPQITGNRLATLFRPRSVALVGASDKSLFSQLAYRNLVEFGFADRTYLVNRRGAQTHGRPTVTSCAQIGAEVDVAFMMVPQAGTLEAMSDAAAARSAGSSSRCCRTRRSPRSPSLRRRHAACWRACAAVPC